MYETPQPSGRDPFLRRIETVALFRLTDAERAALATLEVYRAAANA